MKTCLLPFAYRNREKENAYSALCLLLPLPVTRNGYTAIRTQSICISREMQTPKLVGTRIHCLEGSGANQYTTEMPLRLMVLNKSPGSRPPTRTTFFHTTCLLSTKKKDRGGGKDISDENRTRDL